MVDFVVYKRQELRVLKIVNQVVRLSYVTIRAQKNLVDEVKEGEEVH